MISYLEIGRPARPMAITAQARLPIEPGDGAGLTARETVLFLPDLLPAGHSHINLDGC